MNESSSHTRPIILAAGGTGGHIFPAEALAEALVARGEQVVFITDRRFKNYHTQNAKGIFSQIPIHYIRAGSFSGGVVKKLRGMVDLAIGVLQAGRLLRELCPKAVVGFGGYPSFPTMLAATSTKQRTVLHEQNSVLGRTNRALAKKVTCIATTYPTTLRLPEAAAGRVSYVGNPVRAAIRALQDMPYTEPQADGMLHVLVTGGSQGATVFGDVVPQAVALLPEKLRARLRIEQQCRQADIESVRARYASLGIQAELATFFTDVPARLAAAHLVVCRAGASTVAELTVAGRPAVLVPYPAAMDNHQFHNAQAVQDVGGGWVMAQTEFTPQALADRLEAVMELPASLGKAARQMRTLGKPDAAEALADVVLG